jgi:hypothetical protein
MRRAVLAAVMMRVFCAARSTERNPPATVVSAALRERVHWGVLHGSRYPR